ncbi:MAG: hypothetical protein JW969_00910 [Spirochaetales bacterium]|nr:hypothetical protein [Spirochaetales bacterium]
MKKIVLALIGLLAIFSIVRAYSAGTGNTFSIHPSQIEYSTRDSQLSVGFGLIESSGDKTRMWDIFPVKIAFQSGSNRFYLALNGISFLTQEGVSFGRDITINGVHRGDLISFGGKVTIRSRVEGNVWAFGSDINLESGAYVMGDVVSLGGRIRQLGSSYITGNKYAKSDFVIPFLGLLTSKYSVATIQFVVEIFGMLLFLLVLYLVLFFRQDALRNEVSMIDSSWKGAIIYILLSLVVIPVLVIFLVASVIGIILIPVLLVIIVAAAYFGFMAVTIRVGKFFMRKESDSIGHQFLTGLFGLLIIKGPGLVGILLSLLTADIIMAIGNIFTIVGTIALFLATLLGFGVSLMHLRRSR